MTGLSELASTCNGPSMQMALLCSEGSQAHIHSVIGVPASEKNALDHVPAHIWLRGQNPDETFLCELTFARPAGTYELKFQPEFEPRGSSTSE